VIDVGRSPDSPDLSGLFERLESFYDALPRQSARAEDFGSLVLFVRERDGYPYYARPALNPGSAVTAEDVAKVRDRQRQLGVPEAFEWVHETTPHLLSVAEAAGLSVLRAPLMVLDPDRVPDVKRSDVPVRLLDPGSASFAGDVAVRRAVAAVGFGAPGTEVGPAGPAERDAATVVPDASDIAAEIQAHRGARLASAMAALPEDGVVASGMLQRVGDVAEIAGVATLPSARRRGLATAITAVLARHALDRGVDLVFISAGSPQIARVYERVGFYRVGTACIAEPASA
jgi:GNAT superfamily N-acetyltransferase